MASSWVVVGVTIVAIATIQQQVLCFSCKDAGSREATGNMEKVKIICEPQVGYFKMVKMQDRSIKVEIRCRYNDQRRFTLEGKVNGMKCVPTSLDNQRTSQIKDLMKKLYFIPSNDHRSFGSYAPGLDKMLPYLDFW